MKRFFALAIAMMMITALLCACGEKNTVVKTTVATKYDDGYAEQYADTVTTDSDGNKVYDFSEEQYDSFTYSHNNVISADIQKLYAEAHDASYGEYAYINEEKKAVMVGIHEGQYDESTAETEAAAAAEYGFRYFQNLQTPIDTISVIYCNAGDQNVVYGSFEFTAQ